MSDCIAIIEYDIMRDGFVLSSGEKKLFLSWTKELNEFVEINKPITYEEVDYVRNIWAKQNGIREE